jgi:hypothetical protein
MNVALISIDLPESCKTFANAPHFFAQNSRFTPHFPARLPFVKPQKNALFPAPSFFLKKSQCLFFWITFMKIMLLNIFSKK